MYYASTHKSLIYECFVSDFITDTIYSGQWVWLGGKGNNRNNMKWGDKDSKVKDTLSSVSLGPRVEYI